MSTHRREHITTDIRRAVQEVLARGLADPRIRGMLSVTDVEIAPDGREAKVSVSVYPEQYETRSIQGLTAGTMKIQRLVNDRLALGRPPHLRFVLDRSLKKQAQILQAIRSVMDPDQEDAKQNDAPADEMDAQSRSTNDHAGTN